MAEGIYAEVEDGFARLQFLDPAVKHAAMAKLLELAGPGLIDVDTRTGSRKIYIVPESIAQQAGLLEVVPEPKPRGRAKAAKTETTE